MGIDRAELLSAYDELRRAATPPAPGWSVESDASTVLLLPPPGEHGATVVWSRLDGSTAGAAIARHVALAAGRGTALEWKHHDYDDPPDLPDRLRAAGFVPETAETLVAADLADLVAATAGLGPPAGVRLRELDDGDAEAVVELGFAVWGEDHRWLVDAVLAERAADPGSLRMHVAEADDGTVVAAAWVRLHAGSPFASLWGGSTRPGWRRRGVYRSLVALRAREALAAGARWVTVDASPDSRPVLERLGFVPVTATTPYVLDLRESRTPGAG
ncbi:GNAT family N-acetyltransferase [Motilibacter deserti]|uniref:GNAT family N-acetyltransferase n=1 Tax=Motilibacter deserti TaxID=2714956 RepID=A0ABX0H147_9ACTN|nr:GNAT family N-acetyltransferase [Motilibacter deserti]NHC15616.1 GNAT family N-acetyltransferase [Motilibacter deserti]